jgi:signal transduction histidine kinase
MPVATSHVQVDREVRERADRRVLIVDDDRDFADALAEYLSDAGYQIEFADDAGFAVERVKAFAPQVVLVDLRLAAASGIALIGELTDSHPHLLCVLVTAYADVDSAIAALRHRAYDFLRKPLVLSELEATLERAFDRLHLEAERERCEALRRELEAQRSQFQRLETISTLAGGFAHQFNNLLTPLMGYAYMALGNVPADSVAASEIEEVIYAGSRAANLVQEIVAFSRQGDDEVVPVRYDTAVKEAVARLRRSIPPSITVFEEIGGDDATVLGSPGQIQQMVMNLLINAQQAMAENGGVLRVALDSCHIDREAAKSYRRLDKGVYLHLTISDTGHGMDPATQERIFDPYFTTREVGEGSGLGLSVAHGIVTGRGGEILVESEVGKGTTVHVYWPRIVPELAEVEAQQSAIPRGHERILYVDDEPAIVAMQQELLNRLGYQVTTTTSSVQALEMFRAQPEGFDLVITDQMMPQMSGDALAQELLSLRPGLPIVVLTGYTEPLAAERYHRMGIESLLQKPASLRELADAIRTAVAEPAG